MMHPPRPENSVKQTAADTACPTCGSPRRLEGGGCLSCFLHIGLEEGEELGPEELQDVLGEIDVGETEWRLGNYHILEEIGRGGMGVIYRARQRYSKRIVALKRVLSYHGDSRETLERFRREAEAAASLDHPNILPIYEVGEADGLPFFTMKFASGGNLQQAGAALASQPREIVRLLAKVTRGVAYAHSRGILHRDLKPGNILLDESGEPLVTDFGLAKWIDVNSDLTRSLAIFGTPGFIAPEQAEGARDSLKPAADVYSLGAILFYHLAGRPPFLGEHAIAVIRQAAERPAPKLRSLVRNADRDLETICAKCLEREPAARYHSAAELAEDLESWLEWRPIRARPVSPPVQLWRWSRRNPKLAVAAAACVFLVGTTAAWWTQHQALQARVQEEQRLAHSFGVLPFLNLDEAAPNFALARSVATALGSHVAPLGPGQVDVAEALPVKWTGIGTADEIRDTASRLRSRGLLTGTVRELPGGWRVSVHLVHERGAEPLARWLFDVKTPDELPAAMLAQGVARAMYRLVEQNPADAANTRPVDPGLADDVAREMITAGRWLIDRGRASVTDMDRAIESLESAVQRQPASATARAYLAMACFGRDVNAPDHNLAARALAEARQAADLAPHDEIANRALRMVYATNGHYREALEQAFTSLELTRANERTFGQIAYLWNVLGRPDKAIAWYARAKATGQQLADYEALIGDSWLSLGDEAAAEEHYRASMKLRSDLPDGTVGLSRMLMLRGDLAGARELCERTTRDYPNSPHPRMLLAQIEFFSRNFARAEQLYRELHEASPRGGTKGEFYGAIDYASALARLRLERGDGTAADSLIAQANDDAERQLAEAPRSAPILYRHAALAALTGDRDAALARLTAAVENGWSDFQSMSRDPRFDTVAADPRFQELVSSVEQRLKQLRTSMAR